MPVYTPLIPYNFNCILDNLCHALTLHRDRSDTRPVFVDVGLMWRWAISGRAIRSSAIPLHWRYDTDRDGKQYFILIIIITMLCECDVCWLSHLWMFPSFAPFWSSHFTMFPSKTAFCLDFPCDFHSIGFPCLSTTQSSIGHFNLVPFNLAYLLHGFWSSLF